MPSAKKRKLDVVCVGNVVVDSVGVNVHTIPPEGSLALFDRVELHLGGCANNTSMALAKLGIKVGLVGKVGADGLGDYVAGVLNHHGVDVRGLKHSKSDATSFSFIMVPQSGNRRILHTMAANATFGPNDVDASLFRGAKWVFIGGLALMPKLAGKSLATVLKAARKAGAKTAADTATNHGYTRKDWQNLFGPCYEHLDVLFPSEEEAVAMTGKADPKAICSEIFKHGVKVAGVKLGARGCALMTSDGYFEVPAYRVKCVDTLGAGDCFMAGFLSGLLRGEPAQLAARMGNAVSAHCVQAVGATTGIPRLAKVVGWMKKK